MHTQLVVTPGLNDGQWLEKSIRDLGKLYPAVKSVSVVPVGLTKQHKYGHRPCTLDESDPILDSVRKWQAKFLPKFSARFVYPTDEWFIQTGRPIPPKSYYDGLALEEKGLGQVRGFLTEWLKVKKEISRSKIKASKRTATLVTGTLFEGVLRKTAQEFDQLAHTQLAVRGILNERLGHTITVAGLVMGADVIEQLKKSKSSACPALGNNRALPYHVASIAVSMGRGSLISYHSPRRAA